MEVQNLITSENNLTVHTVLVISKQDMALQNAINSLNELNHINRIEFTAFEKQYGINTELLEEVRNLQAKLQKAKYGRY
jgi:hypothetical protein